MSKKNKTKQNKDYTYCQRSTKYIIIGRPFLIPTLLSYNGLPRAGRGRLGLKGVRGKAGIAEIMNKKNPKILPDDARYRPSGENARE